MAQGEVRIPLLDPAATESKQNGYGSVNSGLSTHSLSMMVRGSQTKYLENLGGPAGLAKKLQSSAKNGLDARTIEQHRKDFGSNYVAPPPAPSYLELILTGLEDTTIIMLIISSIVSLILGLGVEKDYEHGWIEGTSIIISILVVVNVQAITDYSKAAEFRRQQIELENQQHTTLIREGSSKNLNPREIVVGDILRFGIGDILPVDGVLIEFSDVKMDESSLTGETKLISKDSSAPFILSGTNVMHGSGKILVVAVGKYSMQGSILADIGSAANDDNFSFTAEEGGTLVEKLDDFAVLIGKFGMVMASITFIAMTLRWLFNEFYQNLSCEGLDENSCSSEQLCIYLKGGCTRAWTTGPDLTEILNFIVTAITILVVAIPEGLPLAVTLSLAISMRRMTRDNNQVKHMDACETMGSATTICSDKTGTLTLNKMTVVRSSFGHNFDNVQQDPGTVVSVGEKLSKTLSHELIELLSQGLILNTGVSSSVCRSVTGSWIYKGNATECALLKLALQLGFKSEDLRGDVNFKDELNDWGTFVFPFSSERKRMSYVVPRVVNSKRESGYRLYTKGAPDYILASSEYIVNPNGVGRVALSEAMRAKVNDRIREYQRNGLRVIGLGYREFDKEIEGGWGQASLKEGKAPKDAETHITFLGIVGIEDPLRPEVIDAIKTCNSAGVDVRMCTGDALETGVSIALQCGILKRSNVKETDHEIIPLENFAMTGPEFRERVTCVDNSKPKVLRNTYDKKTKAVVERMERPYLLDENGDKVINQEELDKIWPKLRVLARCQPEDKLTLVRGMRNSRVYQDKTHCAYLMENFGIDIFPDRQVVAVTGDGTNDAPALKNADVGFAMGIVGTDTAKQACDIVLLDDNFSSIVQAIKWGRNVFDSISKFIQFQLTVNVVAIVFAIVGAILYNTSPLSAVQMLWINLIMDSLASLALATEPPTDELLKRKPYGKRRPMLSKIMMANILGQSFLQLAILLTILLVPSILPGNVQDNFAGDLTGEAEDVNSSFGSVHWTIVFNVFVQLQLFNELNSRKLQTISGLKESWSEWNVFENITKNDMFISVMIGTTLLQIVIVQFGGAAFKLCKGGLSLQHWILSIGLGALSLPWQFVINNFLLFFAYEDDELVIVDQKRSKRKKHWGLVRENVRYGSNYARVFNTSVKKGMTISRMTMLKRGETRPNYRYPITKSDSLETEKLIQELARRRSRTRQDNLPHAITE